LVYGDLDLWGVDRVNASMATVVGQIKCTDTGRWPVQREFYRRMKKLSRNWKSKLRDHRKR
jgi:hypothetical protein